MLDFCMVTKSEINSYLPAIKQLITAFSYPLTYQKGTIDYGNDYAAFFSSFGEPYFFLLFDKKNLKENKLIGTCVATKKLISISDVQQEALYFSNLRIDKRYQLTKTAPIFYRKIMQHIAEHETLSQLRFFYFATMTTERIAYNNINGNTKEGTHHAADFMRIKSRASALKLFQKTAECLIYLVPPDMLANITIKLPFEEESVRPPFLNLSPETTYNPNKNIVDLSTAKDFIQNDKKLSIAHLANTSLTGTAYLTHLKNVVKQAAQHAHSYDYISFALDTRREKMIDYLAHMGILSETRAMIYCYNRTKKSIDHKTALIGTYQI